MILANGKQGSRWEEQEQLEGTHPRQDPDQEYPDQTYRTFFNRNKTPKSITRSSVYSSLITFDFLNLTKVWSGYSRYFLVAHGIYIEIFQLVGYHKDGIKTLEEPFFEPAS